MAVGAHDDAPKLVGAQDDRAAIEQRVHDIGARVSIGVPGAHRDHGHARPHRVQERTRAAGRAAVVPDLEYVGTQQFRFVRQQPRLLRRFGVPGEEETDVAVPHEGNGAGEVGVGEMRCPGGVRREKAHVDAVEGERIARMDARPRNPQAAGEVETLPVRRAPAGERGVAVQQGVASTSSFLDTLSASRFMANRPPFRALICTLKPESPPLL